MYLVAGEIFACGATNMERLARFGDWNGLIKLLLIVAIVESLL